MPLPLLAIGAALAYEAGSWLLGKLIDEVAAAPDLPDDRPLPVFRGDADAGRMPADAHSEYLEAFGRLDALMQIAEGCGLDGLGADDVRGLRAAVARGINAGIYQRGDGFVLVDAERPTRGQVRGALAGLATTIGRRCDEAQMEALSAAVAEPLDRVGVRAASSGLVPLFVAALVIIGALALWGLR